MPASSLPRHWHLPESISVRLGQAAGPQRAIFEEGHLLLVLHQVPQPGSAERQPAFFWRDAEGKWRGSAGRDGIDALREHLGSYFQRLRSLEDEEKKASSAREYHALLEQLAPLLRAVRHTAQAIQEGRKLVPQDRGLIDCRDDAAQLERFADLLMQDSQHGLDFTVARRAEEEAEAARRLNLLAAFFLPLTTLSAVLSMNVRGEHFWLAVGAGVGVGVVLALMVRRR